METKEVMDGEKPTSADELSAPKHAASSAAKIPLPLTWEDKRASSASQFFERLNLNEAQPEVQRDLTLSEFLEFLGKQRSEAQRLKALSLTADGSSQGGSNKTHSMYNKDWNQEYQTVAIDQCDITSSVDYGSRDFYPLSTHTSGSSYIEDKRASSASQFFERLNLNQAQPEVQRDLTSSEFLEFLGKQRSEAQLLKARSLTADGNSQGGSNKTQSMYNKDWNQEYQRVAIDQCDITSSVDYGSRDFYPPSTHTSGSSYIHMENESDEITGTDTRGNWWQGSFYY